jgi:hypothetical protein
MGSLRIKSLTETKGNLDPVKLTTGEEEKGSLEESRTQNLTLDSL